LAGATPETCDGVLDEDCDGTVDDGCDCTDGQTRSCGSDIGECVAGTETCVGGTWNGICAGEVGPAAEICDNKDNDCDSEVDEDNVCMRECRDLDDVECRGRNDCKWDDDECKNDKSDKDCFELENDECKDRSDCEWDEDECVEKDWSWWWDKYLKSVSSLIGRMF
jgi:hypothetical protein